jgi:hypothetical protein
VSRPARALAVIAFACAAVAAEAAPLTPPARADAEALAGAVAGVERDAPKPAWSAYLPVLVTAVLSRLWESARPLRFLFDFGATALTTLAWVFVIVVLIALLAVLCGFTPWKRAARGATAPSAAPATPAPPRAATDWLLELERRLAAGDLAGALEALWWVFAGTIAHGEVRASWTSGELVARAGREDLRPLAAQLDRFRYGPLRPAAADVRALAGRLSARVGAEARP